MESVQIANNFVLKLVLGYQHFFAGELLGIGHTIRHALNSEKGPIHVLPLDYDFCAALLSLEQVSRPSLQLQRANRGGRDR